MRGGDQGRLVTPGQRAEILSVYVNQGIHAAGILAQSYGLTYRYPSALASKSGVARKRLVPLNADQKAKLRKVRVMDDSNDPRWKWAVERGPVLWP